MRIDRRLARIRGPFAFWAAAGVALLVSHDAIFLIQIGPGQALVRALRAAGHEYWGAASLLLGLIGIAVLAATMLRLRGLRRQAAALHAAPVMGSRRYAARGMAAWARLLAVVATGFLVQENIEHLIGHSHAPGLAALIGPEYPLALPVIALISGLAAVVVAALSQAELALLAVIADAIRRQLRRPPRRTFRPPLRLPAVLLAPMARDWAGRAPPGSLVSAS
jgi:hypothetical protein